jgi:hypothetical protein
MDEEELRRTLLWLIERDDAAKQWNEFYQPPGRNPCGTCGHELAAHVVNGDADNPTPWPCAYPKILGAPHTLCRCQDFDPIKEIDVEPREEFL